VHTTIVGALVTFDREMFAEIPSAGDFIPDVKRCDRWKSKNLEFESIEKEGTIPTSIMKARPNAKTGYQF
jgi:hypothetical protein